MRAGSRAATHSVVCADPRMTPSEAAARDVRVGRIKLPRKKKLLTRPKKEEKKRQKRRKRKQEKLAGKGDKKQSRQAEWEQCVRVRQVGRQSCAWAKMPA